ncbi:serine/threonine-protein kinase [Streptomyces hainanensis]|uniref:serine/threonine-protein kinase n=1 Tax=Streptomyces hainanensis TaxID=402648 RepID=UPI001404D640|nr:serine/threonine-protein kinase [Streptomyces hainanensis]
MLGTLGSGGMGAVYLARSQRGRLVAVKLVRPDLASNHLLQERLEREIRSAMRVEGEWVAAVRAHDVEAAMPWVVSEYVPGLPLDSLLTRLGRGLAEHHLFALANGLGQALLAVHAAGLVHRDLKPSNVMITVEGPRVIDFGIAYAVESAERRLTRTGAAVGTPAFMSPEQFETPTALTPASDVFALGSVLTYAATGATPFGPLDSDLYALMLEITRGTPRLDDLPAGIRPLIASCLDRNPADRPSPETILATTFDYLKSQPPGPWLPPAALQAIQDHDAAVRAFVADAEAGAPVSTPPAPATPYAPTADGARTASALPTAPIGLPPAGFGPPASSASSAEPSSLVATRRVRVLVFAVLILVIGVGALVRGLITMAGEGDDRGAEDSAGPSDTPPQEGREETTVEPNTEEYVGDWQGTASWDYGDEYDNWAVRVHVEPDLEGGPAGTVRLLATDVLCEMTIVESSWDPDDNDGRGAWRFTPDVVRMVPEDAPEDSCPGEQGLAAAADGTMYWWIPASGGGVDLESTWAPQNIDFPPINGQWEVAQQDLAGLLGVPGEPDGDPYQVTVTGGGLGAAVVSLQPPASQNSGCSWEAYLATVGSIQNILLSPFVESRWSENCDIRPAQVGYATYPQDDTLVFEALDVDPDLFFTAHRGA